MRIAAQTRHKDLSVLFDRCIRFVDVLGLGFSKNLGLGPTEHVKAILVGRVRFHNPGKASRIVLLGAISVAQAAERLGVSVPRIHQRIADGSLIAERVGSQWVVDERSLLHIQERSKPGHSYAASSAWAVIAVAENDRDRLRPSGSAAWARARMQVKRLWGPAEVPASSEEGVGDLAVSPRSVFRNRAERRQFRAAPADLADLRADDRWAMIVDLGGSASPRPTSRATSESQIWPDL